MEQSIFRNKKVKFFIRLITALSFTLFTVYQFYLALLIPANRAGRFTGICLYLLFTIASYFAFSKSFGLILTRTVLLIVGMLTLFILRLLSIPTLFEALDFSYTPSVLNCLTYIISQIGCITIMTGTLLFMIDNKINKNRRSKNKFRILFVTVVGVLYAAILIMDCVLMIKYRVNIEMGLKITLISRLFFFLGYFGTAAVSILPPSKSEHKPREGQFFYSEDNEDEEEVDMII